MPMYIKLQNRSCFTDGHRGGHVPCHTNHISILHIFYLAGFHIVEGLDKKGYPPSPLDVRPNGGQMYFNMQKHFSYRPYGNPEAKN